MKEKTLPEEVSLVNEIRKCRDCPWFWEGIPPYGPYPAIDWDELFPEAMRHPLPPTFDVAPLQWTKANAIGDRLLEPAALKGCRKAPIMALGINPNLGSYFLGPNGATHCYPCFSKVANYAYYHRHATIFQECLDEETIRSWIVKETELQACADGWILAVERGTDHRWLCLTVKYVGMDAPVQYEMTWKPDLRAVVLVSVSHQEDIEKGMPAFTKGTVLAAKIRTAKESPVSVYEAGSGYYQRLLPLLEECRRRFNLPKKAKGPAIGEDISMYDIIGCASPGWSSQYDIPRSSIANRCVGKNRYIVRQLLQSRPAILLLVSSSALHMFEQSFASLGGSLTFSTKDRDVYDLLKETCCRHQYFVYEQEGIFYRARVIVTPHFSYAENFVPHARFSQEAWDGFCAEFPEDRKILEKAGRIGKQTKNDRIILDIKKDDPLEKQIGYAAWQILLSRFYDPYALIAEALTDEYKSGNLIPDRNGHLKRSDGPCSFCTNAAWTFPEGCPYGKTAQQ